MANAKHLKILEMGVQEWNRWRSKHPNETVDLSEIELSNRKLCGINLCSAELMHVILQGSELTDVNFSSAFLVGADLSYANLTSANLSEAQLSGTSFLSANLTQAILNDAYLGWAVGPKKFYSGADLSFATLHKAKIRAANLYWTKLFKTDLSGAVLTNSTFDSTIFSDVKLNGAKGLATCIHHGPSTIDHRTLLQCRDLPIVFLKGCGLQDWEIETAKLYQSNITSSTIDEVLYRIRELRIGTPIQISNLFISYSHKDSSFIEVFENKLNTKGIRFWRDVHHATSGPMEKILIRAMKQNPTVVLILSQNSVKSDWVEYEVSKAHELERELGRDVLCPISLDDSWKTCGWSEILMKKVLKYNILDFSDWRDSINFEDKFQRLINGLKLFYRIDEVIGK